MAKRRKFGLASWLQDTDVQDVMAQLPEAVVAKLGTTKRPRMMVRAGTLMREPYAHVRGDFTPPAWDLSEIAKALDVESYVQLSCDQLRSRILREPWVPKGRNDQTVAYILRRIKENELATGVTFNQLITQLAFNIVAFSNAFIIKVRDSNLSSGKIVRRYGRDLAPIAAVFSADPTSIEVKLDQNGVVELWRQYVPGRQEKTYRRESVSHIAFNRRDGFIFGIPTIIPVLDDIRALRRIEELAEILTGRHAFPLYHYKVGTESNPAQEFDSGQSEVDIVKHSVEAMPLEGAVITSERHEITAISPELPDVVKYLDYFRQRVHTGLRISSVDSGAGNTANRATAGFLRVAKDDLAKSMQDVLSDAVSAFLFDEWLEEGGYPLNEDNRVLLWWPPIDPEEQRLRDNHVMLQYQTNLITEAEARMLMGKQPFTTAQHKETHLELIQKPLIELAGKIKAQQAGDASGTVRSLNRPTNQSGTKPARTTPKNDAEELTATELIADNNKSLLQDCLDIAEAKSVTAEPDAYTRAMGNMIDSILSVEPDGLDTTPGSDGLDAEVINSYRQKYLSASLSDKADQVPDAIFTAVLTRVLNRYKPGPKKKD